MFVYLLFRANLDPCSATAASASTSSPIRTPRGSSAPVGHDRWAMPGSGSPNAASVDDFTPGGASTLIRDRRRSPGPRGAAADAHAVHDGRRAGDHLPRGDAFLVGDAAHRMTPAGALGMNTAIVGGTTWAGSWPGSRADGRARRCWTATRPSAGPRGRRNARRSLGCGVPPRPASGPSTSAAVRLGRDRRRGPHRTACWRAPHAWVSAGGRRRSLLDLFDSRLTLLVGPDAAAWRAAPPKRCPSRSPGPRRRPADRRLRARPRGRRGPRAPRRVRGLARRDHRVPRGPAAGGARPDAGPGRGGQPGGVIASSRTPRWSGAAWCANPRRSAGVVEDDAEHVALTVCTPRRRVASAPGDGRGSPARTVAHREDHGLAQAGAQHDRA